MKLGRLWLASLALAGLTGPAAGQAGSSFADAARLGTARYRDQSVAIAAGYRPMGPDAPGMGRHWVNPRLVVLGSFAAAEPAVLTYVSVDGRPELVGVVYAIPLRPGRTVPDGPVGPESWHAHRGTLDDEGSMFGHDMAGVTGEGSGGVAVLHAWIWQDNPDGLYRPDNWALPFVRTRVSLPEGASGELLRSAAIGFSLPDGGSKFLLDQLTRRWQLSGQQLDQTSAALDACAFSVSMWRSVHEPFSSPLGDPELQWLAETWRGCQGQIGRLLPDHPAGPASPP